MQLFMITRRIRTAAHRGLAVAALAAYGALGVFGHGLHALVPCADGCGASSLAASHDHCSCHHVAQAADEAVADGPTFAAAEHDAAHCPLCVLLAKIKVSPPTFDAGEQCIEPVLHTHAPDAQRTADGHRLAWTARGPPQVGLRG
jgi:hypothetical protein